MNMWLNTFSVLAQNGSEDPDSSWTKLLFPLIIMILYGLSSLFKSKQQKKPPSSTKAPPQYKTIENKPSSQQQRLPSYARKATTRPGQAQPRPAPRPVATSPTRQPGAQGPVQSPPVRQPMPTRPVPAQSRRPSPVVRQSIERQLRSAKPPAVAQQAAGAAALAAIKAKKQKHQAQLAYEQQKKRDVARTVKQLHHKVTQPHEIQVSTASAQTKLISALRQSDEAARAIVYAEIIGKPLALRKSGLYEF